jgi:hypothetical protein
LGGKKEDNVRRKGRGHETAPRTMLGENRLFESVPDDVRKDSARDVHGLCCRQELDTEQRQSIGKSSEECGLFATCLSTYDGRMLAGTLTWLQCKVVSRMFSWGGSGTHLLPTFSQRILFSPLANGRNKRRRGRRRR